MSLLTRSADGPGLVVCSTCRFGPDAYEDAEGVRGGARLLEALLAAKDADSSLADLAIEPMPCLFACSSYCTIHLRAPGKIGYVLGRFEPTIDAATAILEYARRYMASDEGVVPYRDWPEGVKGHFIVRTPPTGHVVGS
ncbi:DUF1636 domain-containing protein [Caulobacter mirabilis]|uniref:Metal-binding protein n=1 Tax=Caulobacter mirabilis TaxID=69666 RepID=A0A2D2AY79_9CAUL|nr:DUF1636 domain-containing protein [Caulobacter mirabilis]ATQ42931.1 metal-binding protein [Caulobacter mirabilis]